MSNFVDFKGDLTTIFIILFPNVLNGHSHVVTSYQEQSRCQNKLLGQHCGDLIHYIFLYSATTRLSTKLYETADVTSNLGSDLELLESIKCESSTSEVESETELEIEKDAIQNQKILTYM